MIVNESLSRDGPSCSLWLRCEWQLRDSKQRCRGHGAGGRWETKSYTDQQIEICEGQLRQRGTRDSKVRRRTLKTEKRSDLKGSRPAHQPANPSNNTNSQNSPSPSTHPASSMTPPMRYPPLRSATSRDRHLILLILLAGRPFWGFSRPPTPE